MCAAINIIEGEGVKAIEERLRQLLPSTKVLRQPSLRFGDGNLYKPDIVVYQPQTNHILVSDIKYACMAFSSGDVHSDIVEFQGWKAKMREYVEHVQREPERVLELMNVPMASIPTVFGLICPRWPVPVPVEFDASLAAVDYGSLTSHLAKTGELPLAELHRWATDRPDVPVASSVREIAKEVIVGDWTYRYHVLSP
jgi:hypothetical protein